MSNLYDEHMLTDGKMELVGDSTTRIEELANADIEGILGHFKEENYALCR